MKKTRREFSIWLSIILAILLIRPSVREPYLLDDSFKTIMNMSKQKLSDESNLKNKKKKR